MSDWTDFPAVASDVADDVFSEFPKIGTAGVASTFATPDDIQAYQQAKRIGLSDSDAFKVGDNGRGAWGDDTTSENDPIVALPPDTPGFARNRKVEVFGPDGRSAVGRIADVMPPRGKLMGAADIDLNPAMKRAIGHPGGVVPVTWRFADDEQKQPTARATWEDFPAVAQSASLPISDPPALVSTEGDYTHEKPAPDVPYGTVRDIADVAGYQLANAPKVAASELSKHIYGVGEGMALAAAPPTPTPVDKEIRDRQEAIASIREAYTGRGIERLPDDAQRQVEALEGQIRAIEAKRPSAEEEERQSDVAFGKQMRSRDIAASLQSGREQVDKRAGVDPDLEQSPVTQVTRGLTRGAAMAAEASIPVVGLPAMAMAGAAETYGQAIESGKSEGEADAAAARSLIGLAVFGGQAKGVAAGLAKIIPEGSGAVRAYLTQFVGQSAANEATGRILSAWEAASGAPDGQKLTVAKEAAERFDLAATAQNLGFAAVGANHSVNRTGAGAERVARIAQIKVHNDETGSYDLYPAPSNRFGDHDQAANTGFQLAREKLSGNTEGYEQEQLPEGRAVYAEGATAEERAKDFLEPADDKPLPSAVRFAPDEPLPDSVSDLPKVTTRDGSTIVYDEDQHTADEFGDLNAEIQSLPRRRTPQTLESTLSGEADARRQHEDEQLRALADVGRGEGRELLDAIEVAGGLPVPGSDVARQYRGELRNALEMSKGGRLVGVKGVFAGKLFRKDAPSVDELARRLRDHGFNVDTPNDLFNLLDTRLRTGRPHYGNAEASAARFGGERYEATYTRRTTAPRTPKELEPDVRRYRRVLRMLSPKTAVRVEVVKREQLQRMWGERQEVPDDVAAAHLDGVVYIVHEAMKQSPDRLNRVNFLHELAHGYERVLPPETLRQLRARFEIEKESRRGTFYDEEGNVPSYFDQRVATDFSEWFAEKIAWENHLWARGAFQRADKSLIGRIAYDIRRFVRRMMGVLRPDIAPSELSARFREWMHQGARYGTPGASKLELATRYVSREELRDTDDILSHHLQPGDKVLYDGTLKTVAEVRVTRAEARSYGKTVYPQGRITEAGERAGIDLEAEHWLLFTDGSGVHIFGRVTHPVYERGKSSVRQQAQRSSQSGAHDTGRAELRVESLTQPQLAMFARRRAVDGDLFTEKGPKKPAGALDEGRRASLATYRALDAKRADGSISAAESETLEQIERELGQEFLPGVEQSKSKPEHVDRRHSESSSPQRERLSIEDVEGLGLRAEENGGQQVLFARREESEPGSRSERSLRKAQEAMSAEIGPEEALFRGPVIEGRWRRFFYEGARDVFDRTPGLKVLGEAIRKHVDQSRKYSAELTYPYRKWEAKFGRKERKRALADFERYWGEAAKDVDNAERSLSTAPAASKELVNLWRETARYADAHNRGMSVYDDDIQGFRPIGTVKDYFPRVVRPEVYEAISEGIKDRQRWEEITRALMDKGLIARESEAVSYLNKALKAEKRFDYLGAIEHARQLPLPNRLYDYSFGAARRYMNAWAERRAQVEAFGQKTGTHGKDLFDIAAEKTFDRATREYIKAVQDRAYGVTPNTMVQRVAALLNSAATPLHLGNPKTIERNLVSGLAYNVTTFGVKPSLRAAVDMRHAWKAIDDAYARGVLSDDLWNLMRDAEQLGSKPIELIHRASNQAMTALGYKLSEDVVRAHSLLTAKAFLRQAVEAYGKNPRSRAAVQFAAFMRRNGHNIAKLADEGGKGELTDRYLRESVNLSQGGYRYDQVPVFVETPIGRFLFKYQKWGTQATRNFVKNVLAPAVVGTELRFKSADGNVTSLKTREFLPLTRYLVTTAVIGQAILGVEQSIFGTSPGIASWDEIVRTWDDDKQRAMALTLERTWKGLIAAGGFGIIASYGQGLFDVAERRGAKSPLDPPALSFVRGIGELAFRSIEQGKLTRADFDNFLNSQVSLYRTSKQIGARSLEVAAVHPRWQRSEVAKQDLSWAKGVIRRYAEEQQIPMRRTAAGRIAKTEESPFRDAMTDALMIGDAEGAQRLLDQRTAKMDDEQADLFIKSLKASVRARQPIRAGAASDEGRELFMDWAERRLSPQDIARLRKLDETYRETAGSLELMSEAGEIDLEEAMRKRASRRQLSQSR